MPQEIKQNFTEKLRLICIELDSELDKKYRTMLAEHSRDGLLGSGATIKKTINFIAEGNSNFYRAVLDYLESSNIKYYSQLESDIQELVCAAQKVFKSQSLKFLTRSTEVARSPDLYERVVKDVEAEMATDLANFQNKLNSVVLELKLSSAMPPITKAFWLLEAVLVSISLFIAGIWYKDPVGNYEPILAGLGLSISLIGIGIKFSQHKSK